MKSRVNLSSYCKILTGIIFVTFTVICVTSYSEKALFYCMVGILAVIVSTGLLYAPRSITADDNGIKVSSCLKSHGIAIEEIASVELYQPTMGAIRVWASGGFMGYWGTFRERDTGKYTAYYGKSSDCFMVILTTGKKYVLGCENPQAMVDYIKANLRPTAAV